MFEHTSSEPKETIEEYDKLMSSLLQLKQTRTVLEYHAEFEASMYPLLALNANLDMKFFVGMFVLGLHKDIRAAVQLQSPSSFTHAMILARIKEGELKRNK